MATSISFRSNDQTTIWVTKHHWGNNEQPDVYYTESAVEPTEDEVVELHLIDFEPARGERLQTESITPLIKFLDN